MLFSLRSCAYGLRPLNKAFSKAERFDVSDELALKKDLRLASRSPFTLECF